MKRYLIAGLFLIAGSCKKKPEFPKDVIPPAKMQAVLWDVIRADAYTQEYTKKDETKNPLTENAALQKRIFSRYGITRQDFTRSFNYYTAKPDLINGLLDTIIAHQSKNRAVERLRLE